MSESLAKPIEAPTKPKRCPSHPDEAAVHGCADCGAECCDECGYNWEEDYICGRCIEAYRVARLKKPEGAAAKSEASDLHTDFSYRTVFRIVLSPGRFFSRMPLGQGPSEAMLFALVWGAVLCLLSLPATDFSVRVLASTSTGQAMIRMIEEQAVESGAATQAPEENPVKPTRTRLWALYITEILTASASASVLTVTIFLFMAIVQHLALGALGYDSKYDVTVRIAFFAVVGGAVAIIPIPIVSIVAGMIYPMVINVIGLRTIYGTPSLQAAALVIVSSVASFIFVFALAFILSPGV